MNIIKYIKEFGLTEYQSRVMLVLFKRNQATAKDISEFSAIPLTKIYQVLNELEEMSLINSNEAKPKKYIAEGVDETLQSLLEIKQKEINSLINAMTIFLKALSSVELQRVTPLKRIHPCLEAKMVASADYSHGNNMMLKSLVEVRE